VSPGSFGVAFLSIWSRVGTFAGIIQPSGERLDMLIHLATRSMNDRRVDDWRGGAASALLLLVGACARGGPVIEDPNALPPFAPPAIAADSSRATVVSPGVTHRYYWMREGPWAVHVLDIDRSRCWTLGAAKGGDVAVGRSPTSGIAERRARESDEPVAGGVNADFFLFAPPGVPTGAHIDDGRVIAGPGTRPVVLIDSAGAIVIDTLRTTGWVSAPTFGTELTGWNRPLASGLTMFDQSWGAATDSASGVLEVIVSAVPRGVVLALDSLPDGVAIPRGGAVLALGRAAPAVTRLELATLRPGIDSISIAVAIAPRHPRETVGGFPILVRDGAEVARLDSAGGAGFGPVRHPRTAVGVAGNGRRVLLVVVDGRQPPYSDGMTLRELSRLMLALGADDALNLDGGGSSVMVVASGRSGRMHVVNRPSDQTGERAVGNALLVEGCGTP
jgi:hypothetical protein